ncbi:hypothetical protein JTE90_006886 [Oedothorax gibbosus]|uniref:Protein lin-52 homolog n=1 Tax=Oedothorax gibbosus TaxID=931172 RepID=A0AAV6VPK4_9ARAC|nr:hypothetical protein JTE90_006886 [Oedothorax gibbosus]
MAANETRNSFKRKLNDESNGSTSPMSPIVSEDSNMDLISREQLDRSSPEIWPEQIPGVSKFAYMSMNQDDSQPANQAEWLKDLDHEDYSVLQGFGSLTAAALLEKVREIQNLAFQLGLEESKEMTRGRFLGILPKKKDIRR